MPVRSLNRCLSPQKIQNLYEVLVHGNAPVKPPIRAERDRPLNRPSGAGFRIEFKSVPRQLDSRSGQAIYVFRSLR
jgi:hypothetical protein